MKLGSLLGMDDQTPVTGFAIDHRKVAPGTIFGAFEGAKVNGEDFIEAAIAAGAVAVVARPGVRVEGAVHISNDEPRRSFALLAAKFFQPFPDICVAVTGTNGKTTVSTLIYQIFEMLEYHLDKPLAANLAHYLQSEDKFFQRSCSVEFLPLNHQAYVSLS